MALLTFYKDNQEMFRYTLRQEVTTVGRSSSADVCLPDTAISRIHCAFTMKAGDCILSDKSTNGTTLNGKRVVSQKLRASDEIGIGDWRIEYSAEAGTVATRITDALKGDPTEIISFEPNGGIFETRRAVLTLQIKAPKEIVIDRQVISFGKSSSNDVCLANDQFISNYHCRIESRRGRYFIRDLQSTNGTFVNNQQVVDMEIPDRALIKIGGSSFLFEYREDKEVLQGKDVDEFFGIIGRTTAMQNLFGAIERVAPTDATVLITGESGSGKDLVAQALHNLSPRSGGTFVALNCAAVSKELVESELFGHERGAFTSAHQTRRGSFEEAQGGTIFLDEIGDLPLDIQPKLLRVLENREIKRVGSNSLVDIDVRVVCATNMNLSEMVERGSFRQDLLYRINIVPLHIPPLRERVDDIPLLVEFMLNEQLQGRTVPKVSEEAMEAFMGYQWPGNVRELKNVVTRALLNAGGTTIEPDHLNFAPTGVKETTEWKGGTSQAEPKGLREFEKERILEELKRHNWNKRETADALGIARSTLFEKIKKYDLKQ